MALALVIIGILMIASAVKGTEHSFGTQLENDLFGSDGFILWIAAIGAIGLLGKIPGFAGPAKALLVLVFAVILLGNPDFFTNLASALKSGSTSGPLSPVPLQTPSSASTSTSTSTTTTATPSPVSDVQGVINDVENEIGNLFGGINF